jgi:hypothetical protein
VVSPEHVAERDVAISATDRRSRVEAVVSPEHVAERDVAISATDRRSRVEAPA